MTWNWLSLLRCQQCLGTLALVVEEQGGYEVRAGTLSCPACEIHNPVVEGMAVFGMSAELASEQQAEIWAENDWHFNTTSPGEHFRFAETSFRVSERIIRKLKRIMPPNGDRLVLDVGAGGGAQAWLLARHGYRTIAADISPENMAVAGGYVERGGYFGRLAVDCRLLPFAGQQFDVLFCKEFVHHIANLPVILGEFARLLKLGGVLILHDPVWPLGAARKDGASQAGLHHHHWSSPDYVRALRKAGFEVVSFLNQRGPVNAARSRLLSRLDRTLIALLREQEWEGPLWFKLWRCRLLGGSITSISCLSEQRSDKQNERAVARHIEKIEPITSPEYRDAVIEVKKKQVPAMVELLERVMHEPNEALRMCVNSRSSATS